MNVQCIIVSKLFIKNYHYLVFCHSISVTILVILTGSNTRYRMRFSCIDKEICRSNKRNQFSFHTSGQRTNPQDESSAFVWKPESTGSILLSYTNWRPGEPSGLFEGSVEGCLSYWSAPNYPWNDVVCSWPGCALCQINI